MTNKYTINSQIITLLHVSTLSCHPRGACNQHLAKLTQVFQIQLLVLLPKATCETIVHLFVIIQNYERYTVHVLK